MRSHQLSDVDGSRSFALIMEAGDEAMSELQRWANEHSVSAARFTAVGAFSEATLGWFDLRARKYRAIPVREQVEVLALTGDVALDEDGEPSVHAHVVVGTSNGQARGGHLLRGVVRPTLELILDQVPARLQKRFSTEFGLALIEG